MFGKTTYSVGTPELTAPAREAIREYVHGYLGRWWGAATVLVAIIMFVGGYGLNAYIYSKALEQFEGNMKRMASEAINATAAAEAAAEKAAIASLAAEDSAKSAVRADDQVKIITEASAQKVVDNEQFRVAVANLVKNPIESSLKMEDGSLVVNKGLIVEGTLAVRSPGGKSVFDVSLNHNGGVLVLRDHSYNHKILMNNGEGNLGGNIQLYDESPGNGGKSHHAWNGRDGYN